MRLVTSLIALALAVGALVVPGAAPDAARAAGSATPTLDFAAAAAGSPTPGVLAPGQDLVVSGSIANPTSASIAPGSASIVLNPAAVRSRSELSAWLNPSSTSADEALGTVVFQAPTPEVPAGRTVYLQFTVPAASIAFGSQASIWGTRTLAVRVSSAGAEVGQARSSIVWNPGTAVEQTKLTMVMPLTVPQSSDGLIPSDLLVGYTADGGLLSRELDAVFDQPGVAIAIDPRILASIRILGTSVPPAADAWLKRLESATNDTFALSYADSDLAAASQAKSARVLTPLSFPVDARLFPNVTTATPTAQPTDSPSPAPTSSPTPVAPTLPDVQSLQYFDYTLPAVAWPADDSVVEADLDTFEASGLSTTILSSDNVGYGSRGDTPSTATLVGAHRALIADSGLSGYLRAAASAQTVADWDRAMSALSSAIAVVSLEQPATSRTLLLTLDRTLSGGDVRLAMTLATLATLPWAGSTSLGDASAAFASGSTVPPSTASLKAKPEPAARIAAVTSLFAAEVTAGSFSSILADPTRITGERRLSMLALLSNSWAGDVSWAGAVKKYLDKSTQYVTKSVTVARSSNTVITSRNSGLPITVSNELPWPVTVYVTVRSPSNILTIDNDRVALTIEPQSQAKTTVPVTSNANGQVSLQVSLSSATSVQITAPTFIDVDVQAGWETAFTAVIALLLLGVFGFGIYRNIARRRRAKRREADGVTPGFPDAPEATEPESDSNAEPTEQ
jgi:hypothetical protein